MPVPASEAIASDVGHGALGLRDNLRPMAELLGESAGQRHVWCQARPVKLITQWTAFDLTGTYQAAVTESFDGVARDVVGVKTTTEILVRAETAALCQITPGTYFYDPDAVPGGVKWDTGTGEVFWDVEWDKSRVLLVHLTANQNPNQTSVVAQLGFFFGSHGVFQPTFGPDKLVDGGLEVWTSSSDLTNWSEATVGGGGGAVAQDSAVVASGSFSARIEGLGGTPFAASGGRSILQAAMPGVAGARYRASGYYRTALSNSATVGARIRVGFASNFLLSDGKGTTTASEGILLVNTGEEWRRFAFDFICPGDTSVLELAAIAYNTDVSSQNGKVWFDGLKLQRIWRFELYEPRLAAENVPTVEASRSDAYFGPVNISLGALTLLNGSGFMESLFGRYDWLGQEVAVLAGGKFPHGSNEVLLDDVTRLFVGIVRRPEVSDGRAMVQLQDVRNVLGTRLPDHYYSANGRPKPRLFGRKRNITPVRVATTPPNNLNDFGVWELNDPENAPNTAAILFAGQPTGTRIVTLDLNDSWVYVDQAAAEIEDPAKRVKLQATHIDDNTGHFFIVRNPGPFQIVAGENDRIDFVSNGVTRLGVLTPGVYDDTLLTVHIGDVMTAAAGSQIILIPYRKDHPSSTSLNYKVEISYFGAGTFQLLIGTGANKQRSIYRTLGFTGGSDLTGAVVYNGDTELPRNPDTWVIRAAADGYQDDAAGTFTGTPNALITKAPDVLHCILDRFVRTPVRVDLPSFVAARATSPAVLSVYLGHLEGGTASDTTMELAELIEIIENGAGADVVLDVDTFFFRERDGSTPADVVDLFDRDYLSFLGFLDDVDNYQTVVIAWNRNPTTGEEAVSQFSDGSVPMRLGRTKQRTFRTFLSAAADVQARLGEIATQASAKARYFSLDVKGKALRHRVGDKLRLNRSKGLVAGSSGTGSMSTSFVPVTVRVLSKLDNYPAWTSAVVCVEAI